MFARTVSVSLGGVRPPPTEAQCLRAASTAGALLAGYFPHLRGAFQFPAHLAALPVPGDVPLQCSTGQQHPQIASLLSTQGIPSCKAEEPLLDQTAAKADTGTDIEAVRANVVATLMDKEYRPRIQRLEDSCLALRTSKMQCESEAQRALDASQKTRELNRRLCRELNEVRTQRTAALEELERLKQEVKSWSGSSKKWELELECSRKEVKQMRSENTTLQKALQDSQQQVLDLTLSRLESDSRNDVPAELSNAEGLPGVGSAVDNQYISISEAEAKLAQKEDGGHNGDTMCGCNDHFSWGCTLHRVYSDSLLLAHRDVASKISRGPPGLEPETPPGLECMLAGMKQPQGRLHLMPACQP